MTRVAKLLRDERGATSIEYGLILSFIFLAIIVSLQFLASETISMWDDVSDRVVEASNPAA